MPSNIQHENISAAKLGIETVSKGYIGHNEVYPNTREIQSAVYTSGANLSYLGGTRTFRVTGQVGSTYNLTGSGAGTYTLGSSPYDHSISVGSNGSSPCYSGSSRTITTTLTPTGSTLLQGGGASFTSSYLQNAGGGTNSFSFSQGSFAYASISIAPLNNLKTTIGGTTYWADGATFRVTMNGPQNPSGLNYPVSTYRTYLSNIYGTNTPSVGGSISGNVGGTVVTDYTVYKSSNVTGISYVRAIMLVYEASCWTSTGSPSTSNLYP
jgi:hypothetical protein